MENTKMFDKMFSSWVTFIELLKINPEEKLEETAHLFSKNV